MIRETLLRGCGGGTNAKTVTQIGARDPDSTLGRLEEVGGLSSRQWLTILLEKERARGRVATVQVSHNWSNGTNGSATTTQVDEAALTERVGVEAFICTLKQVGFEVESSWRSWGVRWMAGLKGSLTLNSPAPRKPKKPRQQPKAWPVNSLKVIAHCE